MTTNEEAQQSRADQRRYSITYRLRLSALYHLLRERFYDRVDKVLSVLIFLSATAAVAALVKSVSCLPNLDVGVAVLTALLAVVQLVWNPSSKARHHGQKAFEFRCLHADCERAGEHWTEAQCSHYLADVMKIEASEPAPMAALVAHCQNQLAIRDGGPIVSLKPHERYFKNWFDFDAAEIDSRAAKQSVELPRRAD